MSEAKDISEIKPLKLKVLDMGMGQERCCWFSKGSLNQYEATMPKVCKYLFEKSNLKPNWEVYKKFLPYSGILNLDEVDNIDEAWDDVAKLVKIDKDILKEQVEKIAGIYSIADHTRTLLYTLSDGALPSNVKGGYNLRLILRRALDFIYKNSWDIDLYKVIVLHAKELSPLYPELEDNLVTISKILDHEHTKYLAHKEKVAQKMEVILKQNKELKSDDFVKLYISEGLSPFDIKEAFSKKNIKIDIPMNFYTLMADYFEENKNKSVDKSMDKFKEFVKDTPPTELLYYNDNLEVESKIIKEFELKGKKYIVLDKTLFYPTMGGQPHDIGFIENKKVVDVLKLNNVIIHEVK